MDSAPLGAPVPSTKERLKTAGAFVLRVVAWCTFVVWPSYLLQLSVATAFRDRVTHPFSAALDIGLIGLPLVATASAGYAILLMGVSVLVESFIARALGVLVLAVLVQLFVRSLGLMEFETHPIPIGLGFVALLAVSLFEVAKLRKRTAANALDV